MPLDFLLILSQSATADVRRASNAPKRKRVSGYTCTHTAAGSNGDCKRNGKDKRVAFALRFFDLEAVGSDDESESDFSDESEVFDEDNDHHPSLVPVREAAAEISDEEMRAIAAGYEKRAREERNSRRTQNDVSHPLCIDDIAASPIYLFLVPEHTEYAFMHFLFSTSSVKSAFTRKIGGGAVFVETEDANRVQRDLRSYSGSWRMYRPPRLLEILESVSALSLPPLIEHVGKYRRLRKPVLGLHVGDPVFVYSGDGFLAIPRVQYQSGAVDPIQALFDEPQYLKLANPRCYSRRNGLFILGDEVTVYRASGLQQVYWDEHRWLDVVYEESVELTDDELALYALADDDLMRYVPCQEPSSALLGGDRVVAVAGEHEGRTGRIVTVWSDKNNRRLAVVQDEKAFRETPLTAERKIKPADCFLIVISQLRLHILAGHGRIEIGDRVRVVSETSTGNASARVVSKFNDGWLEILWGGTEDKDVVHISQVHVDLNVGDIVKLVRGDMGGSVACAVYAIVQIHSQYLMHIVLSFAQFFQDNADNVSLRAPIRDLTPHADDWLPSSSPEQIYHARAVRNQWLDEMYMGKTYQGIEVMICGRHPKKGCFGTIYDYHHLPADGAATTYTAFWTDNRGKLQRDWKPNASLVMLAIALEMSDLHVMASMDCVVERSTQLSLWDFKLLRTFSEHMDHEHAMTDAIKPSVSVASSSQSTMNLDFATLKLPSSPIHLNNSTTVDGEETGEWLTRAEFVSKRIDVKISDLKKTTGMRFLSNKAMKCKGQTGYMVPFAKPVCPSDFSRRGYKVQLDTLRAPVVFPADTIRPCREHNDHTTIDAVKCRVIIIGPDSEGSHAHIGQYGETVPFASGSGKVVRVRFSPSYSVQYADFQLVNLCRSRNVEVQGHGLIVSTTSFV
ncbi:hypothetical protein C8R45DRAFT_947554 [Mycena sanguinolenta]|nr:hypothetical protein C8R45DRAFT_947554 [Mycena sanguinolenta]